MSKITNDGFLNPVWQGMLYSCTQTWQRVNKPMLIVYRFHNVIADH